MFWYIGYLPFVSLDAEPTFLSQDRRRSLLRTKTGDGRSRSSPADPTHRNDDRSLPGMSDPIERERLFMIWLSVLRREAINPSPRTDVSTICFSCCSSSPSVAGRCQQRMLECNFDKRKISPIHIDFIDSNPFRCFRTQQLS
jgi:hypothetical protein